MIWQDGQRSAGTCWLDVIEAGAEEVLASYGSTAWRGYPAVLGRPFGDGQVIYLGTRLDDDAMSTLIETAGGGHGPRPALPRGWSAWCARAPRPAMSS